MSIAFSLPSAGRDQRPSGAALFDRARTRRQKPFSWFSEQSLVNRFLFRTTYGFSLSMLDANWLEGVSREGRSFASPLDLAAPRPKKAVEAFIKEGKEVGPFSRYEAEAYARALGPGCRTRTSRDHADYVYSLASLRDLCSPSQKKARQYVRRLRRERAAQAGHFKPRHADDAKALARACVAGLAESSPGNDLEETLEAIDLACLGLLEGLVVFLDGRLAGYVLVDTTIDRMLVALSLKSIREERGVVDLCFQELFAHFPDKLYVNTCQDLGLTGLRARKLRMRPLYVVDKYYLAAWPEGQAVSIS